MRDKNIDNRKSKAAQRPIEREGVEYIPSNLPKEAEPIPEEKFKREPDRAARKSNFAALFAATIMFGVIIVIVTFAVAFNAVVSRDSTTAPRATESRAETSLPVVEPVIQEIKSNGIAVIREIDSRQRTIQLYSIDDDKTYTFAVENSTTLKSRFGETLVFAELKVGDIVDISFDEGSGVLTSLVISTQAFQLEDVSRVQVDVENGLITIGNDHYYFSDKTTVSYNGEPYPIANIDPVDVLTIKGYQNHIYDLKVNRSHGLLSVKNKDIVINGTLEINTAIYVALDDSDEYKLLEGNHRIVVKGSNIEPFTKDVQISQGEHLEIDMNEANLKAGTITVTSNVEGSTLTMNGTRRPLGQALILNHGEYRIVVQHAGYITHEETIDFTEADLTIEVELEEEIIIPVVPTRNFTLTTDPDNANIFIDGVFEGVTPLRVELPHGSHEIIFRKEGYIETVYPLVLDRDTREFVLTLQSIGLLMPE